MDFYYTDHSFDIFRLPKLQLTMLYFCVKNFAQKDYILSIVLLTNIYFNNSGKRISDMAPSGKIVGFKQRHRNQFFYKYISKRTVADPKKLKGR